MLFRYVKWERDSLDRRVVDQNVESSKMIQRMLQHTLSAGLRPDVNLDCRRDSVPGPNSLRHLLGLLAPQIGYDDTHPVRRQPGGNCTSYSLCRPADYGYLAYHRAFHRLFHSASHFARHVASLASLY